MESLRKSLTPRALETLRLLLNGKSEKEIGYILGISRHTVHTYVKQIYLHYEVQSRAELMAKILGR